MLIPLIVKHSGALRRGERWLRGSTTHSRLELQRRRDAGKPVEYGVNYAAVRYMKENGAVTAEEAERLESGEVARGAR